MRLGESDLSCILCNRGICDPHFRAATLDVPSAQQFQGVCAVCLAQNPSLSELVYLLTSHGQSGTALLVFHNPQADGELGDHLETLLTSRSDGSVRLARAARGRRWRTWRSRGRSPLRCQRDHPLSW